MSHDGEPEILGADGRPVEKVEPKVRARHCGWLTQGCRRKVECSCPCENCTAASVADALLRSKEEGRETVTRAIRTEARLSNASARMLAMREARSLGLTPRPFRRKIP